MTSHSSSTNSNNPSSGNRDGVVLQGYHKKLKTMKKKYFVLYSENGVKSARLEYYDSEKKFKARSSPKRIIILKNCFNINRRLDTKHSNVIALSTKEEVFCIVLETEAELNEWLRALLALQRGEDTESDPPKPFFEHVWQVQMQRKGIAEEKGLVGKYYVCLTTKSVTLVRIGAQTTTLGENRPASVEFYLTTIRRCGDSQCFFFMEVGRHSALGAGELWMQTEDSLIAQNMHTMIISAMSSSKNIDDGFGPMSRKRSSSANEASKPISMTYRRQTHSGTKPMNSSPLNAMTTMCHQRTLSLPNGDRSVNDGINATNASTKLLIHATITHDINGTSENNNGCNEQQYVQPCHQRTRSLPLTEETSCEIGSFHPSSLASTAAALRSFSNNNNLLAKNHCKSYPNRMGNSKINGSSLSCTPTLLASSSSTCSGHSMGNMNSVRRKLSCSGQFGGNGIGINVVHYMNGHSVDEVVRNGMNDKNNNSNVATTADSTNRISAELNAASSDAVINTISMRNGLVTINNSSKPCANNASASIGSTTTLTNPVIMKSNKCSSPTLLRRGRNIRSSRSM